MTALAVGAIYSLNTTKEESVAPEAAALLSNSLSAECETPLFREISEISTHTDDARLVQYADLLSRCKAEINAQLKASNRVRLIDRQIEPFEGLINFETPHVHPIDLTPDQSTLLVVNTAAATLEVFTVSGESLTLRDTIPVGLDPVSVRARSNNEVWVVNQISDSVSIVDLQNGTVVRTLKTGNEPADVVFAGAPERAFVTASEVNQLNVFNLANLEAAPQVVRLDGEDPRALAVSNDGSTVYAAIFESSNDTFLNGSVIAQNDPKQDDNDVAIIDANNLGVSYQRSLMNMVMGIAVNPSSGQVSVVGTQSNNHIAREPNLNGIFVEVHMGNFAANGGSAGIVDLNPHLDYSSKSIAVNQRIQSIGDPRSIAFNADGSERYIVGMGSNNLIVSDVNGTRLGLVDVGAGPTGIVVNNDSGLGYVLNRFEGSVSVVDLAARTEVSETAYYDPTPARINEGRVFVFNTHISSGLGQASCGSCHVDVRADRLGWDLGDANGTTVSVPQGSNNTGAATGGNFNVSPLKGVMVTQTLQDIMEHPSLHWRGDKADLNGFNGTFTNLMGADAPMSQGAMDAMADYLATVWFPPNPYRGIDDSRPRTVTLPDGSTVTARASLNGLEGDNNNNNNCLRCHTGSMSGTRNAFANNEIGSHIMSPSLSGIYDKIGLEYGRAGFGFFHNGVADIKRASRFNVQENDSGLLAELLTLDGPTGPLRGGARRLVPHAGVGQQLTLNGSVSNTDRALLNTFISIASGSEHAALIAKARIQNNSRGFAFRSGQIFDADRAGETQTRDQLIALAESGTPVTFTLVAEGTERRLGLDLNNDGVLDGDALTGGNTAPELTVPSNQTGDKGAAVSLQLQASDSDGDPLSFSASSLPTGLSVNSETGLISGVLDAVGVFVVVIQVSDGTDEITEQFLWTVENFSGGINRVPNLEVPSNQLNAVGEFVSLQLVASDADGDSLGYSSMGLPSGLSVDAGTGLISGTLDQAGTHEVLVTVDDGSDTTSQRFNWVVSESDKSIAAGDNRAGTVARDEWHYYVLSVDDTVDRVRFDLSELSDDADLYIRQGSRPSGHVSNGGIFDGHSALGGTSNEVVELPNTGANSWYVGVHGWRGTRYTLNANSFDDTTGGGGGTGDGETTLIDGDGVAESVATGAWTYFKIQTTDNHSSLSFDLSGLQDDADLYVRAGARPSGHEGDGGVYDCGSFRGGTSAEHCTVDNTGATTWYVGVYGYRSSSFNLLASLVEGDTGGGGTGGNEDQLLTVGEAVSANVDLAAWHYYVVDVPVGDNKLSVSLSNLTADIDLYVRAGSRPSGSVDDNGVYDCGSFVGGTSSENCDLTVESGERYYIGVHGYRASSYSVLAQTSSDSINVTELSNGVTVNGTVAQGQWAYYKLDVVEPNNRLVADLVGLSADIDLYVREGQPPSGDASAGANADCQSVLGGTQAERCEVTSSGTQSWYVGVYGYQAGSFSLGVLSDKSAAQNRKNDMLSKGDVVKSADVSSNKVVTGSGGGGAVGGLWLMVGLVGLLRRKRLA